MNLKSLSDYGLGNTPLYRTMHYCSSGNLYLKLEQHNPLGSIKDRTAYYMIKDLLKTGRLNSDVKLVESSSGNLGLALAFFAREIGVRFVCLIDPSLPHDKIKELEDAGVELRMAPLGSHSDYRSARIQLANDLDRQHDWIWTNQYDNPSNYRAHYETTGPEIWSQTEGQIDYLVCSVGTGGTICGVGQYIKEQNSAVNIVAVEPLGSTIFGGEPGNYLSVGTGMQKPSGIFRRYGWVVDYYCKVGDCDSLAQCVEFSHVEGLSVGITTGSTLVVAAWLAERHPQKVVVAIAPDGGESYQELLAEFNPVGYRVQTVRLFAYHPCA